MSGAVSCRRCGVNLNWHGQIEVAGIVPAAENPGGKDRVELLLTCHRCAKTFEAFVPIEDFQVIE